MSADLLGLSSSASQMADRKRLTRQLAMLDEEEQRAYMQFASAYFRGVSGCQWAHLHCMLQACLHPCKSMQRCYMLLHAKTWLRNYMHLEALHVAMCQITAEDMCMGSNCASLHAVALICSLPDRVADLPFCPLSCQTTYQSLTPSFSSSPITQLCTIQPIHQYTHELASACSALPFSSCSCSFCKWLPNQDSACDTITS